MIMQDDKSQELETSLEDINNNLFIILNNINCEKTLFNQICDRLKDKNLIFITTKNQNIFYCKNAFVINISEGTQDEVNDDYDIFSLSIKTGFDKYAQNIGQVVPKIINNDSNIIYTDIYLNHEVKNTQPISDGIFDGILRYNYYIENYGNDERIKKLVKQLDVFNLNTEIVCIDDEKYLYRK
ncbi:MAG: hypothetical protein IJ097_00420 [Bacilli bacterium]|nr:hypothetical protein [Bacilli bacterium]